MLVDRKMKKHGFEYLIITECSNDELDYFEKYYIDLFSTFKDKGLGGLNLTTGGNKSTKISLESQQKTREHCKYLSGQDNPMFGKHHTDETKKKLSIKLSGENNPMFGKHHTDSTRKKMSDCKMGKNNPMFGKHHTEDFKKSVSSKLSNRTLTDEHKNNISKSKKGIMLSTDHKSKISKAMNEKFRKKIQEYLDWEWEQTKNKS